MLFIIKFIVILGITPIIIAATLKSIIMLAVMKKTNNYNDSFKLE